MQSFYQGLQTATKSISNASNQMAQKYKEYAAA
jgi:hypothetical protein